MGNWRADNTNLKATESTVLKGLGKDRETLLLSGVGGPTDNKASWTHIIDPNGSEVKVSARD